MSDTIKTPKNPPLLLDPFSRRRFLRNTGLIAGAATLGAPFVHTARAADNLIWYSGSSARSVRPTTFSASATLFWDNSSDRPFSRAV